MLAVLKQVNVTAQLMPFTSTPSYHAREGGGFNPVYAPPTPLRPPPPASYEQQGAFYGSAQMPANYSRYAASPGAVAPPPTYYGMGGTPGGAPLQPMSGDGFGHA